MQRPELTPFVDEAARHEALQRLTRENYSPARLLVRVLEECGWRRQPFGELHGSKQEVWELRLKWQYGEKNAIHFTVILSPDDLSDCREYRPIYHMLSYREHDVEAELYRDAFRKIENRLADVVISSQKIRAIFRRLDGRPVHVIDVRARENGLLPAFYSMPAPVDLHRDFVFGMDMPTRRMPPVPEYSLHLCWTTGEETVMPHWLHIDEAGIGFYVEYRREG